MTLLTNHHASDLSAAIIAFTAGRPDVARRGCRRLLAEIPAHAPSLTLLGAAVGHLGEGLRGIAWLGRAASIDLNSPHIHNTLGNLQADCNAPGPAAVSYRKALALAPGFLEALYNLGRFLSVRPDIEPAERWLERTIIFNPRHADAWANLSTARLQRLNAAGASSAARRALALEPAHTVAWIAFGVAKQRNMEPSTTVTANQRALAGDPRSRAAWTNLLVAIHYDSASSSDQIFATIGRWAVAATKSLTALPRRRPTVREPSRRLRIGYLSADLRSHVIPYNIEGLLSHHDPAAIEVFLYAEVEKPDVVSRRLAQYGVWRPTFGHSDAEVAHLIRADGIDVLVSLAGHTPGNRPEVMAYRSAPVQLSFHDLSTSGLAAMDGWITDAVLHPIDSRERFSETLLRLPCFYLHALPEPSPKIRPPPNLACDHITFGSFNNPAKLSGSVLIAWARILAAIPGSVLRLGYQDHFGDPTVVNRVTNYLARHGISPTRLSVVAEPLLREAHLARLGDIDIALDSFPFNGSTTTFEALWMGVPVVTMAGERFVGRVGASILTAIGETGLIASTIDDYVETATALACDPERLRQLRLDLRRRVRDSPLCDAPAYARSVDTLYREAWERWGETPL